MDLDDPIAIPHLPPAMEIFEEGKLDHRRRRRNRMRASCLNCYASKRKCNKKRPCGRCVRLGTTGLCVYEVEDIGNGNKSDTNEIKRLRHRIAELESVIRELKNNPHPRWSAPGGVVHDSDFFDSYRRSIPQAICGKNGSPSGDTIVGTTSAGVKVKTEATPSFAPDIIPTARGVLHGSSQASPTYIFQPTVSLCVDSEGTARPSINPTNTCNFPSRHFHNEISRNILNMHPSSKSNAFMYEPAASVNTVTACYPSTADARGDGFSPPPHPHFSDCAPTSNHGFQTAASESVSLTHISHWQHPEKRPDPCNCLKDPMAFGPLVHLGISLRTSREVLERLHPPSSDCVLYCRIYVLEQHIFSVPPHEQNIKVKPSPTPCMNDCAPRAHATMLPHPASKDALGYLLQQAPPSHSTPTYTSTHQCH